MTKVVFALLVEFRRWRIMRRIRARYEAAKRSEATWLFLEGKE